MAEQRILKTEVHSSMGISVEIRHGDGTTSWLKSDVGFNTHIAPSFPSEQMLRDTLTAQTMAAMQGSQDQLDLLIDKVKEEAQKYGMGVG